MLCQGGDDSRDLLIECLVGDFRGKQSSIEKVAHSGLHVYAHNLEVVRRITPYIRDRRASYDQSLQVLRYAKSVNPKLFTKSSLMVGLGETMREVEESMRDLKDVGVDFLTLGQYLQPDRSRKKVERFVHPDEFEHYKSYGENLGFLYVASGPMVRSSYKAGELFIRNVVQGKRQSRQLENSPQI